MEVRFLECLKRNYGEVALHKICCKHDPQLEAGSLIVNVCAGCDKRFSSLYEGISTISLWEVLDGLDSFPFPNYGGCKMSVHDPCPIRGKPQVHKAVRNLLRRMNIDVVETKFHGTQSVCCGDSFYPALPIERIHEKMTERARSMPCDDVCVYCVSCVKSLHIGGKRPRHLVDLLMGEETEAQTYDTIEWHREVAAYSEAH
ncbi:MAG: (Fe-S)-binding protein [Synergistaceae bacterium]|jgi:Fe-S oxidoreductase|nr:(Fe-S)-binding protein [Synergistaceae bacterium]